MENTKVYKVTNEGCDINGVLTFSFLNTYNEDRIHVDSMTTVLSIDDDGKEVCGLLLDVDNLAQLIAMASAQLAKMNKNLRYRQIR